MNITTKIIITDTNIITDLYHANILEEFIMLDNVYVSDMVKNDEINEKTCDLNLIDKIKTISSTSEEIIKINKLSTEEKKLSFYDLMSYIIAKENNYILATGDNRLKKYSEKNGVEVIRTLTIIKLLQNNKIITKDKAIKACKLLLKSEKTRVPKENIKELINELEKNPVKS